MKREDLLQCADGGEFDLAIVGGGIHGACLARDAVLRGLRVVLFEKHDFAYGTSSRSSKLLHGGVRYLEQGNIFLVRDALHERARIIAQARHLTRYTRFLFPIIRGRTRPAWQVALGLRLYDWLSGSVGAENLAARSFEHMSSELSSGDEAFLQLRTYGLAFQRLFSYVDGQVNDTRVTVENIVDAAEEGAATLNHTEFLSAKWNGSSRWEINWQAAAEGVVGKSFARIIANLSGPWLPELRERFHGITLAEPKAVRSRGVHLIFDKPWTSPALILPTGERGRYYFVLPFLQQNDQATLVGTTDDFSDQLDENPQANEAEVLQLLSYLRRDIPQAELTADALRGSFCGLRILADTGKKFSRTSEVSRSDVVTTQPGYLSLIGGKYTTSRLAAERLASTVELQLGRKVSRDIKTRYRPLPGGKSWNSEVAKELLTWGCQRYREVRGEDGIPDDELEQRVAQLFRRFGARGRHILYEADYSALNWTQFSAFEAEVSYCQDRELALQPEDLILRRLGNNWTK